MNTRQKAWLLPPAVLFLIFGILIGRAVPSPFIPAASCCLSVCSFFLLRGWFRYAVCMIVSMTLGMTAGQIAWHPSLPCEGEYEVQGIISDEIRYGDYGQVRTSLSGVSLNGKPYSAGTYWSFYASEDFDAGQLKPGLEVSFRGSLYHPSEANNPDGYDFREELLRKGIHIGLYGADGLRVSAPVSFSFSGFTASLRHRISEAFIRTMGEEAGGYAANLLLGNRSYVPAEDRAAFSRLGIAHILSVSGFHTGILVAMLSALFRWLRLRQSYRMILYGLALLLYCGLCGMSQPVLRASVLVLAALAGKMLNRPRSGLHLTCAVMYIMLLLSPAQITGISFQLSFSAVLGIMLITPFLEKHQPFSGKRMRYLWSALSVIVGAQLGILVPELYYYQKLPLLSVLVSIPAGIAAMCIISLDWIVLLLMSLPALAQLFAVPAAAATGLFVRGVHAVSSLPGITLWTHASTFLTVLGMIPVFLSFTSLFRVSARFRTIMLAAGTAVVCISLCPFHHASTEYIQFSVGDADAAVLWDHDTVYVLDTGDDGSVVSSFLRRNRLIPDAVILTHLHTDHTNGLRAILDDEIPVRLLYIPAGAERQAVHEDICFLLSELRASGTEIRELGRGDRISLPSGSLSVLWPENGGIRSGQDANHYSLVSMLHLNGVSFLHTGDISGEYELYSAVPADLMKAPHHGSASSSSPSFLSMVSPQAVLLSCGNAKRHDSYRQRLADSIRLWSTAVNGAIAVTFDDHSFTVNPWRNQLYSGGAQQ